VLDYQRENFTTSGKQYDLILDLIAHQSVFAYARALKPQGTYFFVGGSTAILFQILCLGPLLRTTTGKNIRMLVVPQNRPDLMAITELCETGKIVPVIDRHYSLAEVPEAFRYIEAGRAQGKVIITLEAN
jgi:NADPH:quinone reductase-like Zn-dependent oxidoreductase